MSETANVRPDTTAASRPTRALYERWRWRIFGITWLAYAGFYLTRKSFSVAKIEMGSPSGLNLSVDQMAWIDGAFLTAYGLGQFVSGICGDRYGPRKILLIGLLGSVAAGLGMGASSNALLLFLMFGLQGFFQSTGWAPLTKNISNFFSQQERGTVMGLWCTNYVVGGFVASIYAGYFGGLWGWRYAFFVPALTLLGIWFLFLLLQRNRPEDVGLPPVEDYHHETEARLSEGVNASADGEGSWRIIMEVLRSPMVLLLAAVYFFMKPARYAILFWGPKYLHEKLGTNMAQSGALSALFELAGPVSIFMAGVISDRVFGAKRNPISIICLVSVSVLLFAMDKLPATKWMLGGTLLLIGFLLFAPDSLVSGTAAIDFGTKKGASTAAGLINGFGSVGAIVGGTIPGFLLERWGWGGIFTALALSLFLAACLLLPKWHALPQPTLAERSPRPAPSGTQTDIAARK